jgi:hypothetical protein
MLAEQDYVCDLVVGRRYSLDPVLGFRVLKGKSLAQFNRRQQAPVPFALFAANAPLDAIL